MNNSTPTQAQIFAVTYAADMAAAMLKTIKRVRQAATVIMLIAMVVSYTHQADYLSSIKTPLLGAWLIPGALDALTFLCVKVLGTPGMAQPAKTMALRVLAFPVLASSFINAMGPGSKVTKVVFVICVLLIPAAELVASRVKPDFTAMDAMERNVTPAAPAEVDDEATQRRREAAKRGAAKRAENRAAEAARKAAALARRRAKRIAPDSPPWVIEEREPTTAELAAIRA